MNRLDKVVVFRSLHEAAVRRILELELEVVQRRILAAGRSPFVLKCSDGVKEFLLKEGFDRRYGARPLKRAIERHLVLPISNLIATGQISGGDVLLVEMDEVKEEMRFSKARGMAAATGSGNVRPGASKFAFGQTRLTGV
jgi:ATP-dependent Clp protease ATP-binding subunit ClpA